MAQSVIRFTNSMELGFPWEATSCSVSQEFAYVIRNTKVYYRV
jgi:hypothetical protein